MIDFRVVIYKPSYVHMLKIKKALIMKLRFTFSNLLDFNFRL